MIRFVQKVIAVGAGGVFLFGLAGYTLAASDMDTTPPSDVEKLVARALDGSVKLSWEAATDDSGIAGYRVYSGTEEVSSKNMARYADNADVGDVLEHEAARLENGTIYYFAVTALDNAGNESESYSPYVTVRPLSGIVAAVGDVGADDTVTSSISGTDSGVAEGDSTLAAAGSDTLAPAVVSADSVYRNQVKVIFSEAVRLPDANPESAFTVQDNLVLEYLKVKDAFLDPADGTGKTVLLDTADQNPGSEYVITAGIGVEDVLKNPISSGNHDFAKFTGSAVTLEEYLKLHPAAPAKASPKKSMKEPNLPAADKNAEKSEVADDVLKVVKVEALDETSFKILFSQAAVLGIDPTVHFEIVKKDNTKAKLTIASVVIDDTKKEVIVSATMEPKTMYVLKVSGALDSEGAEITEENGVYEFSSIVPSKDNVPPEEVTNLIAQAVEKLAAKLKWTGSKNSAGDLMEYILYKSTDGKSYGKIMALSKENTNYTVAELQPGYHYFKVTARDETGNESKGKIAKIRITETGPGVGLIALASIGLGRFIRRRKR